MRIFITGEDGFIAKNLPKSLEKFGSESVSLGEDMNVRGTEVCVYNNSVEAWAEALKSKGVDLIIHNAAVVGTDVVAMDPGESTLSNVTGTHTICRAAKRLGIPVCYIGTTVVYDTPKYQDTWITEESAKCPRTLYGIQKLAAENIVTTHCDRWLVIRPLFAYGGVGDMNSLIAKTFYSFIKNKNRKIDMFLDPTKYKDYMHVEDFCDAVSIACHGDTWNDDFNVSAETPLETGAIIELMSDIVGSDLAGCVNWHTNTDYLGNHRLSSKKFRTSYDWNPSFSLSSGIRTAWESIQKGNDSYNPLKYLDQAKENNIDLTEFY
jgi:dTDP-glucose 4,6-dehydratase